VALEQTQAAVLAELVQLDVQSQLLVQVQALGLVQVLELVQLAQVSELVQLAQVSELVQLAQVSELVLVLGLVQLAQVSILAEFLPVQCRILQGLQRHHCLDELQCVASCSQRSLALSTRMRLLLCRLR
jgi:hypothetical protein